MASNNIASQLEKGLDTGASLHNGAPQKSPTSDTYAPTDQTSKGSVLTYLQCMFRYQTVLDIA